MPSKSQSQTETDLGEPGPPQPPRVRESWGHMSWRYFCVHQQEKGGGTRWGTNFHGVGVLEEQRRWADDSARGWQPRYDLRPGSQGSRHPKPPGIWQRGHLKVVIQKANVLRKNWKLHGKKGWLCWVLCTIMLVGRTMKQDQSFHFRIN